VASPCVSLRPHTKKVTVPDAQVTQSRTDILIVRSHTSKIATTKAIVNVYNHSDTVCFLWSILAAKHPATHLQSRIQHYRVHLHELVTSNLTFPLPVCDISKFENANADIIVNVCIYEDGKLIPLYVPHRHRNLHVNLLLLKNHNYVLIRHLSRLVARRNKHDGRSFVRFTCKNSLLKKYVKLSRMNLYTIVNVETVTEYPCVYHIDIHQFSNQIIVNDGNNCVFCVFLCCINLTLM